MGARFKYQMLVNHFGVIKMQGGLVDGLEGRFEVVTMPDLSDKHEGEVQVMIKYTPEKGGKLKPPQLITFNPDHPVDNYAMYIKTDLAIAGAYGLPMIRVDEAFLDLRHLFEEAELRGWKRFMGDNPFKSNENAGKI